VRGEITSWTRHRSGHCYYTLGDGDAQIDCVMWRHQVRYVFFTPKEGMEVEVKGNASIYERRGKLQLVTRSMKMAGEGALQQAFEELKQKLTAEGLFADEHKQPLPSRPRVVGVITAGDSAAFQDIVSTLERRFPLVRVQLASVTVQGMDAAQEIAGALQMFGARAPADRPDVLIVGRGGGAQEDLWAFNEEAVARALFACPIPTISAVGHETDVSIADLVADCRAATPTMAAEIAVPDRAAVEQRVVAQARALRAAVEQRLQRARERVVALAQSRAFARPQQLIDTHRTRVKTLHGRLRRAARHVHARNAAEVASLKRQLELLDPERPLRRGFARVEKGGAAIMRADALQPGDPVTLRFADGAVPAEVTNRAVPDLDLPGDEEE
jgi:exodeoxyribonuclease VII large subunit